MEITVSKKKAQDIKADVYVIAVAAGAETGAAVKELARADREAIAARVSLTRFKGKAGKTLTVQAPCGDVVLVGTGGDRSAECYRRVAASGRAAAAVVCAERVALCIGGGAAAKKAVTPMIEGFLLANYRFDRYRSENSDRYLGPESLVLVGAGAPSGVALRSSVNKAKAVCDAVCLTRDLVNEMSSVKTPSYLAKTAKAVARKAGIKCEVWQGEKLRRENMNGILAVSAGSKEPGAFIKLVYTPKKRPRASVAVVGKGVTFDSGGLSLKPSKSMEWMKQDMAGAAAVIGLMQAVAVAQPAVEVRGYIASAENMPGAGAQKPGDIITYRNGTTAEVLNTDAEGRLVLGDALCVAAEDKPDCIIDMATLTGACMVALGSRIAGILGNDNSLINGLIRHGKEAGEDLWQLPLAEEHYGDDIRSMTADIRNIGAGYGGTITAALFLKSFVGDTKWAHLDIAGPAFAEKRVPYCIRGGTGFGVRTILSYLESL